MKRFFLLVVLLTIAFLAGCSSNDSASKSASAPVVDSPAAEPALPVSEDPEEEAAQPPTLPADNAMTPEQLKAAIQEKNPQFNGEIVTQMGPNGIAVVAVNDPAIEDIRSLAGLDLYILDLHDCHIDSIEPLRGMNLRRIDLSNTGVSDVSVLSGMPLEHAYFNGSRVKVAPDLSAAPVEIADFSDTPLENLNGLRGTAIGNLYLVKTKVKDLEPLRDARLQSIWLNETPVEDCSPLASSPVVSVTLAGTKVSDISCFKGHPTLQRLHIAETEVTDLSPLQWMDGLTRLIFSPNRIKEGIQYARRMQSIREIGTAFGTPGDEGRMFPPDVFWQMYDEGKFD